MALIGAPGRVIFAWLGDIFPKRYVMASCFSIQSVGLILFAYVDGTPGIIFFLVLYAPTYAGVLPLIPAIQAEYFGRKWFGTIRGMMTPHHAYKRCGWADLRRNRPRRDGQLPACIHRPCLFHTARAYAHPDGASAQGPGIARPGGVDL